MHEVSIAQALLDKVIEECLKNGSQSVKSVTVEVGRASGVVADALFFAYNALKSDTIAKDSSLIINEIDISARCDDCQREFTSQERLVFECPFCASWRLTILKGKELHLTEIEVD